MSRERLASYRSRGALSKRDLLSTKTSMRTWHAQSALPGHARIHLLRQYRSTPHPFSSLMFFERRTQSSIKHRRLQYLLLLALCTGAAAAMCVLFQPFPLPPGATYVQDVPGGDRRLTLLWFLEADPRDVWDSTFGGLSPAVADSGHGRGTMSIGGQSP